MSLSRQKYKALTNSRWRPFFQDGGHFFPRWPPMGSRICFHNRFIGCLSTKIYNWPLAVSLNNTKYKPLKIQDGGHFFFKMAARFFIMATTEWQILMLPKIIWLSNNNAVTLSLGILLWTNYKSRHEIQNGRKFSKWLPPKYPITKVS